MSSHSLYDSLYSSMDIGFLFDLVDSLTRELEICLDPQSVLLWTSFRKLLGFSRLVCESSSQWHIDSAFGFSNDVSLPSMGSTNSTYDFSMIPVGSLQDPLMNFKSFPCDSIRVLQGCQYGILESSRIHLGFPWGSHSLLIWFLWTLSGFPKGVHEPDSSPFSQICNFTSRASGFVACPSTTERWLVKFCKGTLRKDN